MSDILITEYNEQTKTAEEFDLQPGSVIDHKDYENHEDPEAVIMMFEEQLSQPEAEVVLEFSEEEDQTFDMSHGFELPNGESGAEAPRGFSLPGAADYVDDDDEEDKEPKDMEEIITDWINDRDPSHFMEYITTSYPDGIPAHDGRSTLGCERAVLYLTKLNKEISEALRSDKNDALDLPTLEDARVNMVRDIVKLKEHVKKLNKKHKKSNDSSSSLVKDAELKKEATTPRVQLIMTPWERAITGIIINSVVSSGKPFEDVYEFLKKKYKFDDREELAILQLLMDMGQPIFKDRGTIGATDKDSSGDGVDFVKNYFA